MQQIEVLFARSNKPFCWLIRLGTLSQWSHVALVDGDYVIDTTLATGVRYINREEWNTHYVKQTSMFFPVDNVQDSIDFAKSQIGKKYDPLGIISLLLRKKIEDKGKWFCSEFIASVLGIKYKPWRLSPQFIWMTANVIKGWIIKDGNDK
jgi:hypothetical protein